MMNKRDKRFDNILDECLGQLLSGERSVEECLEGYPVEAAELEPLLRVATVTRQVLAITPRAEFRARARYQFHEALQEADDKRSHRFFRWQSRWATAVAAIVAILVIGSGTVAAAGNSMPDTPLYPVKLAAEQVQLTLTPSSLGKAELNAKLADRRVSEILYLADKGKPQQVAATVKLLGEHIVQIAGLVGTAVGGGGEGVMLAPAPATSEAPVALPPPMPRSEVAPVPDEAPRKAQGPTEALAPAPERAAEDAGKARPQDKGQAKLKVTVQSHAANHPERLRAALKTAPASVRPALLQAISLTETGYAQVLSAIEGGE
ncbi:MAG: DUF5667 domain-containing protein [Chloroflexota bacterium]